MKYLYQIKEVWDDILLSNRHYRVTRDLMGDDKKGLDSINQGLLSKQQKWAEFLGVDIQTIIQISELSQNIDF